MKIRQSVFWRIFIVIALVALVVLGISPLIKATRVFSDSAYATELLGVDFVDAENGWAVGDAGVIYHTSDGGQSWNLQDWQYSDDMFCMLNGVNFIDQNNGWVVGHIPVGQTEQAVIIHTSNGGASWQVQSTFTEYQEFSAVQFLDSNNGWVTVSYPNNQTILHSTNGGITWSIALSGGGGNNLFDIDFVDPNNGMAVGGKIWHTSDGGTHWNLQNDPVFDVDILYGLEFITPNDAWALGNMGHILHTSDGGNNWQVQYQVPDHTPVQATDFIGINNGWIVGGHILHTTNGGTTWEQQNDPADYLRDVQFNDANKGWAVGGIMVGGHGMATILHTTDGGQHWNLQLSPFITHSTITTTSTGTTNAVTGITVGGEVNPVNKFAVLAPWLALIAIIILGGAMLMSRNKNSKIEK